MLRLWAVGLLVVGPLFLAVGCGGVDYKSRGTVKGKVTVGPKNLTVGTVMFINKEGVSASASIDPSGNYSMPDAPVGECQVTVSVPKLPMDPNVKGRMSGKGSGPKMPGALRDPNKPAPKEEPKAEDGKGGDPSAPTMTSVSGAVIPKIIVQIDEKYSKVESSGLTYKVDRNGNHTFNIELK
jgi:hypothetical protein